MSRRKIPWTEPQIAVVRKMRSQGATLQQIADSADLNLKS